MPEQRPIEQRTSPALATGESRFECGHRVRLVGTVQWGKVAGCLGDLVSVDFPDGDRQLVSPDVIEYLD